MANCVSGRTNDHVASRPPIGAAACRAGPTSRAGAGTRQWSIVRNLVLACLAILASHAGAQLAQLAGEDLTLVHGDALREYYLYVPPHLDGAAPLVVALHGRGGTGPGMAVLTGFDALADSHGFIVAYPSGLQQQWN